MSVNTTAGMSANQLLSGLRTRSGSVPVSELDSSSGAAKTSEKTEATTPKVSQDSGDTTEISQAAREQFASSQALTPKRTDTPQATMSATTKSGYSITLEARTASRKTFEMGNASNNRLFAGGDGTKKTAFTMLAWDAGKEKAMAMEFSATVTDPLGQKQEYILTGNTVFTEDEHGIPRLSEAGQKKGTLVGTDTNDIMLNIMDDTIVDAQKGDDIILSVGRRTALKGGEGDDIITSMGDGVVIAGNDGNDAIAVLHDTLRQALQKEMSFEEKELANEGLVRDEAAQTVSIDGGDGDDNILVRPDVYKANIKGGKGNDAFTFSNVSASTLDGGEGNDTFTGENLVKSVLQAGDGKDAVVLRKAVANTKINLGDGDDTATIGIVEDSSIRGGGGNDTVKVGYARHSSFGGIESLSIREYNDILVNGIHEDGGRNGQWKDGNKVIAAYAKQDATRDNELQQTASKAGDI